MISIVHCQQYWQFWKIQLVHTSSWSKLIFSRCWCGPKVLRIALRVVLFSRWSCRSRPWSFELSFLCEDIGAWGRIRSHDSELNERKKGCLFTEGPHFGGLSGLFYSNCLWSHRPLTIWLVTDRSPLWCILSLHRRGETVEKASCWNDSRRVIVSQSGLYLLASAWLTPPTKNKLACIILVRFFFT